jgi:hypothetical protein
MSAKTTGMDHPLRDALMIEMEELLAEVEVFERGGTA